MATIPGTIGNDTLPGTEGDDLILAGGGDDTVSAGAGNDSVFGDGNVSGESGAPISLQNSLVNDLGGGAGFGEGILGRNDDQSTSAIDITAVFGASGLDFFGQQFTSLYVNNNGNLTFGSPLGTFTPTGIGTGFQSPIIAAFWADVDTFGGATTATPGGNSTGSNLVYYDLDAERRVFTATWDDVGYFSSATDKLNAFQIQLFDRGGGDFDIVFRYEAVNWTTGNASGGSGGLGGTIARAGYTSGTGISFELPQSGDQTAMLGLDETIGDSGSTGVYVFNVRNGDVIAGGNDTLSGDSGADVLNGGGGNDLIFGNADNDTLLGGFGNDTLLGGSGDDLLDGGAGSNAAAYSLAGGAVNVSLAALGSAQTVGGGEGIDTLLNIQTLIGSDFDDTLSGGNNADTLQGGLGNDLIDGAGGNDLLFGGAGNDTLNGGAGVNTVSYALASGAVNVDLALSGQDVGGGEGVDLLQNIQGLIGSDFDDTLRGSLGNETLFGGLGDDSLDGGSGNDSLDGGFGNDRLVGGLGDDSLAGGDGSDLVDYTAFTSSGISVNLGNGSGNVISSDLSKFDFLSGIESVIGTSAADTFTGGAGDQALDGGGGSDQISYRNATGSVTVNLALTEAQTIGGGMGVDSLTSFERLEGSFFDDTLTAGPGGSTISGAGGNDTLVSGAGDDILDGSFDFDWASFVAATSAVSADLSLGGPQSIGGGLGSDQLLSIDGLIGSSFADNLSGDGNGNTLLGGDGDDTLLGGDGDDFLGGEGGDDLLTGGTGFDTLDGGAGIDRAEYLYTASGITVTLANGSGTVDAGPGDFDLLVAIDSVTGSNQDDLFHAGAGNQTLAAGAGNDTISFFAADAPVAVNLNLTGPQSISPGIGLDILTGFEWVVGSSFGDLLFAATAGSTLEGRGGNDLLAGDTGFDWAVYAAAGGGVSVNLGAAGSQLIGADQGSDTLTQIDGVVGSNFGDLLTGDAGSNTLLGGSGNDRLVGSAGDDFHDGGDGIDVIDYQLASGGVSVDLGSTAPQLIGADQGSDTLLNFEWVIGSNAAVSGDTLLGNAGANTLNGMNGDDQLTGGAGADVFIYAAANNGIDNITDFGDGGTTIDRISVGGPSRGGPVLAISDFGASTPANGVALQDFGEGAVALFIDTDGSVGAEVRIDLNGTFATNEFFVATNDIQYNLGPVGVADSFAVAWNATTNFAVLGNDSDPNPGDTLTLTAVNSGGEVPVSGKTAAGSTISIVGNQVHYVAGATALALQPGQSLSDSFVYQVSDQPGRTSTATVSLTVSNPNLAPTPAPDVLAIAEDGAAVAVNVIANDTDPNPEHPSASLVLASVGSSGRGASVTAVGNSIVYNPNGALNSLKAGEIVTDTISYTVRDPAGGTANSTLTVTITGANDAPVAGPAISVPSTTSGQPFSFTVPANAFSDPDGDLLALTASRGDGSPLPAWLSFNAASRTFSGTPANTDGGTLALRLTATDPGGLSVNGSVFNVTINGAKIDGGDADDSITGTIGDDTLAGEGGDDELSGGDGNDDIDGGAGDDTLEGGNGDDLLDGGSGNDSLEGGAGDDALAGGEGGDTLNGGDGDDTLNGGGGRDTVIIDGSAEDYDISVRKPDGSAYTLSGLSPGEIVQLTNKASGRVDRLIGVEVVSFSGSGSSVAVNREGLLRNILPDGVNADQIIPGDDGANSLAGGAGNDTIDALAGDDTLTGSGGNDSMIGGAGNDSLDGGAGNDTLDGGSGDDVMNGGAGNDTYHVDSAGDQVIDSGGRDGIVSRLLDTVFDLAGYAGIEDLSSGEVGNFSAIGNTLGNRITGGAGDDTLAGAGGADTLTGDAGNDSLDGGSGADLMVGGSGNDTFSVDNAADRLVEFADGDVDLVRVHIGAWSLATTASANVENLIYVGNAAGVIGSFSGSGSALANTLTGNSGRDTLAGGAGNDSLVGLGDHDRLDGGADNDRLDGGDGNDTLSGGLGDDILIASAGNDSLIGGAGNDILDLSGLGWQAAKIGESGDGGFSVARPRSNLLTLTGSGNQTLTVVGLWGATGGADRGIEQFVFADTTLSLDDLIAGTASEGRDTYPGSAGNDVFDGIGGDDTISGGAGDDQLNGGGGNDTLDGGDGADTLAGGAGNDLYIVGDSFDTLTEAGGGGRDTVQAAVGEFTLAAQFENLIYTGSGNATLTGNGGANTLSGGAGNDTLDGAGGADLLLGGAGDDSYVVDNLLDVVRERNPDLSDPGGIDTVRTTLAAYTLGVNVENLARFDPAATTAFSGTGNALDNQIVGGAGRNSLNGAAGNDTLLGGAANDTLLGGLGDDTLAGGDGADRLDGGAGVDSVRLSGSLGDYTVVLRPGNQLTLESGGITDTLVAIEQLIFDNGTEATGDDTIVLNDALPAADGRGDGLFHNRPTFLADTLNGTVDSDTLDGLQGNDTIFGGFGTDTLLGGAGNDRLVGGEGSDTLTGGAGADSFVFDVAFGAENVDFITDFAPGDKLLLDSTIFGQLTAGNLAAANFRVFGSGEQDDNDFVLYDRDSGDLFYDADADGAGEAVRIATLGSGATHPLLTAASFGVI